MSAIDEDFEMKASTTQEKTTTSSSSSSNNNLPWVEKYRPADLDEVISHQEIVNTVNKLIDSNALPHLLFYGPPGTGKTSTILAVSRKINGPKYQSMVLELNASDDRGIDVVREQIKDFASSKKLFNSGLKLVILDEADAMTKTAQFALRRVIEKYTKNTRFCLICNYINKIIPALQSRCTRFRFGPLAQDQVETRLKYVIQQEKVNISDDGLQAIMKLAEGDMRKCLNVLQACHLAYPSIDENAVYLCTGNPLPSDIKSIADTLTNSSMQHAFNTILEIQVSKGLSLADILTYLHERLLLYNYPPSILTYLLTQLSNIEYRLAHGVNEKLQLSSLVGAFQVANHMIFEHKKQKDAATA